MAGITVPNPYGQKVAIGPTNGLGGLHEAPETQYGLDKVVGGMTKEVTGFIDQWQDEIDRTNAKDAINKTRQQLSDLETNQESGWGNLLGENALNRPDGKSLVDEYQLKAKEVIDGQRSALKTAAARKYYEQFAEVAYQQNGARLQTHMINQQKVRDKAVSASTIKMAQDDIQSGDLERMQSGFAVLRSELQNLANKSGLPVDKFETVGKMHQIAIEGYIDRGSPDAAAQWLAANRDEMSSEQIAKAKDLIKAGKTTQRADDLAPKMLNAYKDRSELLRHVYAIEDEDLREKVAFRINKLTAQQDAIHKAELKESVDQYWEIVDNGEEPPDTLMERIKELDPEKYRKLRKPRRRTESDEDTLGYLNGLVTYAPEQFAALDLNEVAENLTKADQNVFMRIQKNMGDASFNDFVKTLRNRMALDPKAFKNNKIKAQVIAAGTELWNEAKQTRPKGYIDKATSDTLVERLLGKEDAWFGADRGYQIIANRDKDQTAGMALAAADFEGMAPDTELNEILRRNGITQKVTQQQALYARQIANGYGLPPDIMARATLMAREACRQTGAKLTQELINRTAEKIAFGQK